MKIKKNKNEVFLEKNIWCINCINIKAPLLDSGQKAEEEEEEGGSANEWSGLVIWISIDIIMSMWIYHKHIYLRQAVLCRWMGVSPIHT